METCNWLLSSENDQKACVLEGVQFKLPKEKIFLCKQRVMHVVCMDA